LETAIGNEPNFNEEKMKCLGDVHYAKDKDLGRLKQLNINVVSLANNHFFDLGFKGARHTITLLDELGISHVGAGIIQAASSPVVKTIKGKEFAFGAFCDSDKMGWCPWADKKHAGVNPILGFH